MAADGRHPSRCTGGLAKSGRSVQSVLVGNVISVLEAQRCHVPTLFLLHPPRRCSQTALSNGKLARYTDVRHRDPRTELEKHSGHNDAMHATSLKVGSIERHRCPDRIVEKRLDVGMREVLFLGLKQACGQKKGLSSCRLCTREDQRTRRVEV